LPTALVTPIIPFGLSKFVKFQIKKLFVNKNQQIPNLVSAALSSCYSHFKQPLPPAIKSYYLPRTTRQDATERPN
jgi:hypothetical protein